MIEIKNLTKSYNGVKVVDNISLKVNDGEIFAFIGHNGAGKTTTIKSIVGINNFDSGEIFINGKSIVNDAVNAKKDISYVPDNPDLYENMKAIDFINFICDMYETPSDVRMNNIIKYAKMFEIEDKLNNEISTYSHGMKQKIALIAALSHDPKVLIMDEPFVGLDPKAVFDMKNIMKEIMGDESLEEVFLELGEN